MYWIHNDKDEPERIRKENQERLRKEELERLRKANLDKLDKEDMDRLRLEGFTEQAIVRFFLLRSRYGQNELDQAPLDIHRLEFARWLVRTGRLTDRIK